MGPSPELGEQEPSHLLPPVRLYRTGKEAVPRDAAVIRSHPPLYAGDFDNNKLRNAYYWEGLDRNNKEEERLRLALHYGEERKPRCENCEKEDRACMSGLGKKYKSTGCAFCIRRHLHCSQANSARKDIDPAARQNIVRKNTDSPYRPNRDRSHKRRLDNVVAREGTEPPAKRTRALMNGRAQASTTVLDAIEEFHTPMESRSTSSHHGSGKYPSGSHNEDIGIAINDTSTEHGLAMSQELGEHQQVIIQQGSNRGNNFLEELRKYFSTFTARTDKLVRELRSANAKLTRRVHQLENPQTNYWQSLESRLIALEQMPPPGAPQQHGQGSCTTTTKMLEPRILKLEKANAGLGDGGMGDGFRRLENLTERERGERRAQAGRTENRITNLRDEQAVLQNEHLGLTTRLNDLTKKVQQLSRAQTQGSNEEERRF